MEKETLVKLNNSEISDIPQLFMNEEDRKIHHYRK